MTSVMDKSELMDQLFGFKISMAEYRDLLNDPTCEEPVCKVKVELNDVDNESDGKSKYITLYYKGAVYEMICSGDNLDILQCITYRTPNCELTLESATWTLYKEPNTIYSYLSKITLPVFFKGLYYNSIATA